MTTPAPAAAKKKQRGRETPGDMVRSLGLVLIGCVALWAFAQGPLDQERIRVVDPAEEIAAFVDAAPGAPVPATPAGYQPTSATLTPGLLRIGYVTPGDEYVEYAASTGDRTAFLTEITGAATPVDEVDVDGVTWEQWSGGESGSTSLVRTDGGVTVAVGTLRETVGDVDLIELAAAVS